MLLACTAPAMPSSSQSIGNPASRIERTSIVGSGPGTQRPGGVAPVRAGGCSGLPLGSQALIEQTAGGQRGSDQIIRDVEVHEAQERAADREADDADLHHQAVVMKRGEFRAVFRVSH